MTKHDAMMESVLLMALHFKKRVLILARGAIVFGTPISFDEYIQTFGSAEDGIRKALHLADADPEGSVFLRDAEVRSGGDLTVKANVLALSRASVDGIQAGDVN